MKKKQQNQILYELEARSQRDTTLKVLSALALDYGTKFCGLAFSPDGICVVPLGVFPTEDIEVKIRSLATEKKIKHLILGLPLDAQSRENALCVVIRKLSNSFEKEGFQTYLVNERFSSQQTLSADKNERIDDLAAAKILEYFLEGKT